MRKDSDPVLVVHGMDSIMGLESMFLMWVHMRSYPEHHRFSEVTLHCLRKCSLNQFVDTCWSDERSILHDLVECSQSFLETHYLPVFVCRLLLLKVLANLVPTCDLPRCLASCQG